MPQEQIQALREKWRNFWETECQHCEQKYLTADTHGIILEFISQNFISKEAMKEVIDQEMPLPEEVNYMEDNEAAIKRKTLSDLKANPILQ